VRLVTCTGPGGVGKTRLALEVSAALRPEFADGVFLVSLGVVRDPGELLPAIAAGLGVRERPGEPPAETLEAALRDCQALLLLDNFEHLLAATPAVLALLAAAPRLKVLVTSRAALRVTGEHEFAVPPLALPTIQPLPPPAELTTFAAVQLFCERARAVKADFALTTENAAAVTAICRRLDGLPLAIELAAARVTILPPAALLARLTSSLALLTGGGPDRPARQQTLRATLAWSYDLLTPTEQTLFRRLAAFAGGFSLAAAERVASREWRVARNGEADQNAQSSFLFPSSSVLDGLTSLVAKSLVYPVGGPDEEPRFTMLQTIQEYAAERLAESGEDAATRDRHLMYFLHLVERAEPGLMDAARATWLARLDAEHENLRAALRWGQITGNSGGAALRLAGALVWFWYFRGYLSEGRSWLEGALARAGGGAAVAPAVRAKALGAAGALACLQGEYTLARERLEASLRLWTALGEARGRAYALLFLCQAAAQQGDPRAAALGEESLALFRRVGDRWGLGLALDVLGAMPRAAGPTHSATLHAESLALFRELGDQWGVALELGYFGRLAWQQGDYARAAAQLEEALQILRTVGDKWSVAWALRNLGAVKRDQGDHAGATALLRESLALFQDLADRPGIIQAHYLLGSIVRQAGDPEAAVSHFRESLALADQAGDTQTMSLCLAALAALALTGGDPARAAQLGGAAQALLPTAHGSLDPAELDAHKRHLDQLRRQVAGTPFAAAWATGQALSPAQACGLALQDGGVPLPPPPAPADPDALTAREVEVLRLVADGLTDAEIAARLVVSPRTVQAHLRTIYDKLNLANRSAATRYALEHILA
jgi:non-specific serine/threonine protein kinase